MPRKIAAINYAVCMPEKCENGICSAVVVCQRKVLTQESPYEKPDPPMICVGCGVCAQACKMGAVVMAP